MRALLDIGVLIALLDSEHMYHGVTTKWVAAHEKQGWASCPLTQNGCIRIMSHLPTETARLQAWLRRC